MGSATPPAGQPPATTLSRDDHRALLNHHMGKIREANAAVDLARAPYDAARDTLTATIDNARADLGKKKYTRKRLLGYLEDLGSRLRNLLAEEEQRYQDRLDLGLPVHGEQLALALGDAAMPQEAKDEALWEAEGFMLGRQGKLNIIPDGCPTRFHQTVMKAAEKGMELTQQEFLTAQEAIKRRSQPDAGAAPKDLNAKAEPEPGSREAKKAEKAAVQRAKDSLEAMGKGAEKPDEPKEEFETSAEERAAQKPRLAIVDAKAGRTSGENQQQVA